MANLFNIPHIYTHYETNLSNAHQVLTGKTVSQPSVKRPNSYFGELQSLIAKLNCKNLQTTVPSKYGDKHGQRWSDKRGLVPEEPIYCPFENTILALADLESLGYLPSLLRAFSQKDILEMSSAELYTIKDSLKYIDCSPQDLESVEDSKLVAFINNTINNFIDDTTVDFEKIKKKRDYLDKLEQVNTMEWSGKNVQVPPPPTNLR